MSSSNKTNSLPISIYSDDRLLYEVSRIRAKRSARLNEATSPQKEFVPPSPSVPVYRDSYVDHEYLHTSLPSNSDSMNWSYRRHDDNLYNSRLTDPQEVGRLISAVRRNRRERLGIKEPYTEPRNPYNEDSMSDYSYKPSQSLPPSVPTNPPPPVPTPVPPLPIEDRTTPRTSLPITNQVPKVAIPTSSFEEPASQPRLTPRSMAMVASQQIPLSSRSRSGSVPLSSPRNRLVAPETRTTSTSPIPFDDEMSLEEVSGIVPIHLEKYNKNPEMSDVTDVSEVEQIVVPELTINPLRRSVSSVQLQKTRPSLRTSSVSVLPDLSDLIARQNESKAPTRDSLLVEASATVARVKAKRSNSAVEEPHPDIINISVPPTEPPKPMEEPVAQPPLEVKDLEVKATPRDAMPPPAPKLSSPPKLIVEIPKPTEPANKFKREAQSPWRITSDRIQKFKILISPSESRLQELQTVVHHPPSKPPTYNPRASTTYYRN